MLGAKARAAEYNAAKAASARQASREAEEQNLPPLPAPISLSAFTRTASINRNKGTKMYKPLVLSDSGEEDRSLSNIDLPLGDPESPSPAGPPTNRPASLPPMSAHTSLPKPRHQQGIRAPHPFAPVGPRSMLAADDHLGFFSHYTPIRLHQPALFAFPMTPAPLSGWYSPHPNPTAPHHFSGPLPLPPVKEMRSPMLSSNPSFAIPTEQHESVPDFDPPKYPVKELKLQDTYPKRHVFGPDDASPTKVELKDEYRRDHPPDPSDKVAASSFLPESQTRTPEPQNENCSDTIVTSNVHETLQSTANAKGSSPVPIAPRNGSSSHALVLDNSHNTESATLVVPLETQCRLTTQLQTPDSKRIHRPVPVALPLEKPKTILPSSRNKMGDELSTRFRPHDDKSITVSEKQDLLESIVFGQRRALQPPPGLDTPRKSSYEALSESVDDTSLEAENHTQFPLEDIYSPDWCEVKPVSAAARDRLQRAMRAVAAADDISHRFARSQRAGITVSDARIFMSNRDHVQEVRRSMVENVAKDLVRKQLAQTNLCSDDAAQLSRLCGGTVKAVGGIMATLNEYTEEPKDWPGRRSYCPAPDYAIERTVHMGKETRASLFDRDGAETRVAPARIARDPRFRPQPGESVKTKHEDEAIQRFYGTSRRL